MVYYYTATYESSSEQCPEPQTFDLYMGKNQSENELLIRYGHPEDVWFHVDDLSSAHVYLRMKEGMTMDDIPQEAILDCATLVKANSIAGCKKAEVTVVFTRWKNLKKTHGMADGQVGFHRPENVRRLKVKKDTFRVKKLEKTRTEHLERVEESLRKSQERRLQEIQRAKKEHHRLKAKAQKKAFLEQQAEKERRSYDRLHVDNAHKMTSTKDQRATADASAAEEYEDDFF